MAAPQHALYLPRLVLDWLREDPDKRSGSISGTLLFADVSGFTALSDRLATEMGRGGSEAVTSVMNDAFSELVEIVFLEHGDLLRFGGDALVAVFTGEYQAGRACRAAIDMRDAIGDIDAGDIALDISIGIAGGEISVDMIGEGHRELVLSGPTVDDVIGAESTATAGQIFVSSALAEDVRDAATQDSTGYWILDNDPDTAPLLDEIEDLTFSSDGSFSDFISPDFRDLLTLSLQQGEHRPASIGFIKYSGISALDDAERNDALEALFAAVTHACQTYDVAYVSNDIDKDGGKFILAAGVPRRTSGEEGMGLALHSIVSQPNALVVSGGCARGYVFSGDLGAPSRRVFTVMGDTVNLAARLASAAKGGQVLITEAALERSNGTFETNRLDAISLKGKSKDVAPFEIVSAVVSEAAAASIPLFGRDVELRRVHNLISAGLAGAGTVVALIAEDGMGKGHLAKAALELIGADVPRVVATSSSREAHNVTVTLFAELLGIDQPDDAVEKLESAIAEHRPEMAEWLPLIARNWAIDLPDTETTAAIGNEFVASRLASLSAELLLAAAGSQPVAILIEDLDQADDPSKDFVHQLASQLAGNFWAIVATSQTPPPWETASSTTITLAPFDDPTAEGFVRWELGDEALPASTMRLIVERGKGNPYVLAELTRSAVAGGTVPESIEAAALSKLDRLDHRDKQLLMYAAVLGTEARIDLLASLLPEIASAIEDADSWNRLGQFVDTSVIGKIKFRDPIVRDVAYEMLPQRRRQEIHELVGTTIEKRARRRPERFVDELSYHFHLAEDWERSWEYSRMAAEKAERSYAQVSASRFWQRAIEAGEALATPPTEFTFAYERLGDAEQRAGLFPEADVAYEKAAEMVLDPLSQNRLSHKRGLVEIHLGLPDRARDRFEAILESTEAETADRLEAMLGIAGIETRTGNPRAAADWCDQALELAGFDDYPVQRARAYQIMALASADAGLPDAEEQAKQALYIYEEIGDKAGASKALINLGYHAFYQGNWEACEEFNKRNRDTTEELGDLLNRTISGYNLGELYLEQGRYDEGRSLLEETLAAFRGAGHKVGEAVTRIAIGRMQARLAEVDSAEKMLDRALAVAEEANANQYRNEVAMARAELALIAGDIAAATTLIDETLTDEMQDPTLRARLHTLECYAKYRSAETESLRTYLEKATKWADEVGAPHLRYGVLEVGARLFGESTDRLENLAASLHVQARPVFRTQ